MLVLLVLCPVVCKAQWLPIGPYGGSAYLLATSPSRLQTVLLGTKNALLYRSTDQAATWRPVSYRPIFETLNALVSEPCGTEAFFLGAGDNDPFKAGVYKVAPEGENWSLKTLFTGETVMSLAVSSANCDVIAAGTVTGILLSRDAGQSWRRIAPSGDMVAQPVVSLAFDPNSRETLYAGTPKLPWKTSDGGQTWTSISTGIFDDSDIFSIALDDSRVLIGACSGIYQSDDAGNQFRKILGIPGESRRTYVVKSDPANSRIIYAGTSNGLWKSVNSGATWAQKSALPARSVVIDPDDTQRVIIATDAGVWKSLDGGDSFVPSNSGFVNRKLGAFLDAGNAVFASTVYEVGAGALFSTRDGGQSWVAREGSALFGEHIFHLARNSKYMFAAGVEQLYRSSDQGSTWSAFSVNLTGTVTDLLAIPRSPIVLLSTTNQLLVSRDYGLRWQRLTLPPAALRIDALRVSSSGSVWGVLSEGKVFISTDYGARWSEMRTPEQSGPVYDFALRTDWDILLGTLRGLLFSEDGGDHWNSPSKGLSAGTVSSVAWHPTQRQLMYSVQNGIVWKSIDSGVSWDRVDLLYSGDGDVSKLLWASDYEKLYAIGFARGVFVQNVTLPTVISQRSNSEEVK